MTHKRFLLMVLLIFLCGVTSATQSAAALSTASCDAPLALDSNDPLDAARTIGLCDGVQSAEWTRIDGSDAPINTNYALGHGLLTSFGSQVTVREGMRLLALSTGTARLPDQAGYIAVDPGFSKGYTSSFPPNFPPSVTACSGACPPATTAYDDIALELILQVPTTADSFAFDYKYYTTDFPTFTCGSFNDLFAVLVDPAPVGSVAGNVVLDTQGQPMTVNSAERLQVCSPAQGCYMCGFGSAELTGTGFEGHGATKWLTTTVPATPDTQIRVRFLVYDSGDGSYDATALIDNFRWTTSTPTAIQLHENTTQPIGILYLLLPLALLLTFYTHRLRHNDQ